MVGWEVTIQVNVRDELETASGFVIAREAKQSPTIVITSGDCFVASLLAMTPPNAYIGNWKGGG
jgi:hypothetical protein